MRNGECRMRKEGEQKVAAILWKASRHAVGWGGYQDGFGEIGIQLKKRYGLVLKSKKNREVQ